MILRRVTEHVKAQNWFAVGIDFFIVIVGVFIGIQVANWNATRLERLEESAIVERIRNDFARIKEDSERSLAFHAGITEDLKTLVKALRSGAVDVGDEEAIERALLLGITFQTSADHSGTFTELLSSGRANILRDKELLNELVSYEDFLRRFFVAQGYYVDMTMTVMVPYTSAFQYAIDASVFTDDLQLNTEDPMIADYDFAAMAADPAFQHAAEQLVFIQSLYSMWRRRIDQRIESIQLQLSGDTP